MRAETTGAMQWHNAEVCMDVWCQCGADLHLDGATQGWVECPRCSRQWVLGITLRDPDAKDYPHEPTMLTEDDE